MKIRNIKPHWRDQDDSSVIEELCIALRYVGVLNRGLPDGDNVRQRIAYVKEINEELKHRGLDPSSRIARLSLETNWDMGSLLKDTLVYPEAIPYLASTPNPKCGNCRKRISRKAVLALCLPCINSGLEQLEAGKAESHLNTCPICGCHEKGFLVYAYGEQWMNYCKSCLEKERARREKLKIERKKLKIENVRDERALLCLISSLIAIVIGLLTFFLHMWHPQGQIEKAAKFFLFDIFAVFFIFSLVCFLWSIYGQERVNKLLLISNSKAKLALQILGIGTLLTCAYFFIQIYF